MKKEMIIGAAILIGAAMAHGQNQVEHGGAAFQFAGAGGEQRVLFIPQEIGSKVVSGKPFSAVEERHSLQTLGDGTRIETSETNRLYRDDQGRTRIERKGGNITIYDPVAGFSAELNPATKTGSKTTVLVREGRLVARPGTPVDAARLATLQTEMAQMSILYTEDSPQIAALKAKLSAAEKAADESKAAALYQVQVQYAPPNQSLALADYLKKQAEAQAGPQRLAVTEGTHLTVAPGDNASVESLPSQMVNGALAQGTRTTETIPIGKIGNDRAINVVNERWYSNDLQMLVKSTSSDPRFGDTTYQLTNISQTSPDPSLFQIPADYTIRK